MNYSRRDMIKLTGSSIGILATAGCLTESGEEPFSNAKDIIISKQRIKEIFNDIEWINETTTRKNISDSLSSYEIHLLSGNESGDSYGVTHRLSVFNSESVAKEKYDNKRLKVNNVNSLQIGQRTFATEGFEGRNYPSIYSKYDNLLITTNGAPFGINELIPITVEQINKLDSL